MERNPSSSQSEPSVSSTFLSNEEGGLASTWALAWAQLVSWGSVYYGFSLFVVPMEQALGWSRTDTNAALSFGLLVSGFAAFPLGMWIDRGHGRRIMVLGSALSSAMLLLWSQAHSLGTLFVVWGGLGVSMAATLYDPVFAIVTREFPRTFRTKITLITLVAGFASTVFIPLTQWVVEGVGWRGALMVLGALNLAIALPVHVVAIRPYSASVATGNHRAILREANKVSTRRALQSPVFWALAACFTAYYATFAALTFHLVPLMVERRVSHMALLTTMAIIGPAQVMARALWFAMGRSIKPAVVGIVVTTVFPISVVVLLLAGSSPYMLAAFALLYGGANGMMTILRGTIVQDLMWTQGYGGISGLLCLPSNIAKGVAPISAAAIWSVQQRYAPVEWVILGVSSMAAVAFAFAVYFAGCAKMPKHETSQPVISSE